MQVKVKPGAIVTREQVERSIEGLLERLILYLPTVGDDVGPFGELHKFLLDWVVKNYGKDKDNAAR